MGPEDPSSNLGLPALLSNSSISSAFLFGEINENETLSEMENLTGGSLLHSGCTLDSICLFAISRLTLPDKSFDYECNYNQNSKCNTDKFQSAASREPAPDYKKGTKSKSTSYYDAQRYLPFHSRTPYNFGIQDLNAFPSIQLEASPLLGLERSGSLGRAFAILPSCYYTPSTSEHAQSPAELAWRACERVPIRTPPLPQGRGFSSNPIYQVKNVRLKPDAWNCRL